MAAPMKPITVKWSGREINITGLTEDDTIMELKKRIQKETNVRPDRQKLLGVKCKGKQLTDELALSFLQLKPNTKIMMMGTSEETLAEVKDPPEDIPDVIDDFDIEEEEVAIENREENLSKIERRVKEYEINVLNEPRPGKKLLVLDVDYTLFDHKSVAECGEELKRPYLHEFLESAYQTYDIVIWSATRMKWIEAKMQELGVSSSQNYKICFMLDSLAMISVHTTKYGLIDVKPLAVIWGKYPQWNNKNTIMFDDVRSNFIMNPQSGLKIRPFRQAHFNRDKDKELLKLTKYLSDLADLDDFSSLNHRKWESYKPRKKRRHSDDNQRTEKSPATRAPEDQS